MTDNQDEQQHPSRMQTGEQDPELRKKEAKQKFKIIFLSQIIQMVEVREKKIDDPNVSQEMKDYIDGEIKDMLGKIFPGDEVDQRFDNMLETIENKKAEDPTFTVKHPLELSEPFPSPEAEAKIASEIQERIEKEK